VANFAWLTTAAYRHTFPRVRELGYEPELHTVARCAWSVPLLWLPLFRVGDLTVEDVTLEDGRTLHDPAPVVETKVALKRLARAVPRLNALYPRRGRLNRHAELLRAAVASTNRPFVTLEAFELAWMFSGASGAKRYYAHLEQAFAYFDGPDTPQTRATLLRMTPADIEPDIAFPDPYGYFDRPVDDSEEADVVEFLLGRAWLRSLPWESRRNG
jgi:hypothetical protein